MGPKKQKGKSTSTFKVTPKTDNEVAVVQELQLKKKLFEDKLSKTQIKFRFFGK